MRNDGRARNQIRPLELIRPFASAAAGSVLINAGETAVLCTASVLDEVPPWMVGQGKGWITAEYNMLPGSTSPRKRRERDGKTDGRTTEIQRLIGRSLRAIADLTAIGERTISVDCDVLRADGGTRTASITGAFVALVDAIRSIESELPSNGAYPLRSSVAAISAGMVEKAPLLDLDYSEDFAATVDMNIVMTGTGSFIEVQGTGEEATFEQGELLQLIELAKEGILEITEIQRHALASAWPFD